MMMMMMIYCPLFFADGEDDDNSGDHLCTMLATSAHYHTGGRQT